MLDASLAARAFGTATPTEALAPALPTFALAPPTPNPSPGRVRTTLTLARPARVVVTVVDALGRIVAVPFDGLAAGAVEIAVEAPGLAPGVYALRAAAPDGAAAVRFVVAR